MNEMMEFFQKHLLWMIAMDFFAGFFLFIIYLQYPKQLLSLLKFKKENLSEKHLNKPWIKNPKWLSTQPFPNPDTLPIFLAQSLGPFPSSPLGADINFFTYVFVVKGNPIILKGKVSEVRFFNITFYSSEHVSKKTNKTPPTLNSQDIQYEADGSYVIHFSETKQGRNWINTLGDSHGIVAIRNYFFRNNATIHYPEIWWGNRLMTEAKTHKAKSILENV